MDDILIILDTFESRVTFAFVTITFASVGNALICIVIDFCFGIKPLLGVKVYALVVSIANKIETSLVFVNVIVLIDSFNVGMKLKSIDDGKAFSISL